MMDHEEEEAVAAVDNAKRLRQDNVPQPYRMKIEMTTPFRHPATRMFQCGYLQFQSRFYPTTKTTGESLESGVSCLEEDCTTMPILFKDEKFGFQMKVPKKLLDQPLLIVLSIFNEITRKETVQHTWVVTPGDNPASRRTLPAFFRFSGSPRTFGFSLYRMRADAYIPLQCFRPAPCGQPRQAESRLYTNERTDIVYFAAVRVCPELIDKIHLN